jgi:hypothetical protein
MMCKLNERFKEWKQWYSQDDDSVCAQIRDMLWDAAVFYAINGVRKYATTDAQGKPELNELVHGLINRSFLKTQSLSIRKLYDRRKDVISLRRLVNDMKENKALITRENVLSALELPYDYVTAINEGRRTNNSQMKNGIGSEYIHRNIDLLAGTIPAKRQPSDTVQDSVFEQLNEWLDKCKPIVNFVNKTVTHAATPESKGKVPEKDLKISLAKIHKAHCRIVKIAVYIGRYLLDESTEWTNFLPSWAGNNKFEHFEKPWVRQEGIKKLENCWSQYEKHIEQLSKWT